MLKLQGIAVSPGVTIGEALVLDAEGFRIPRRFVERSAVDTELARLAAAVAEATFTSRRRSIGHHEKPSLANRARRAPFASS